ncbi:MAG: hypothetical protein AB9842_09715 [Bacteroidales bacterium]
MGGPCQGGWTLSGWVDPVRVMDPVRVGGPCQGGWTLSWWVDPVRVGGPCQGGGLKFL